MVIEQLQTDIELSIRCQQAADSIYRNIWGKDNPQFKKDYAENKSELQQNLVRIQQESNQRQQESLNTENQLAKIAGDRLRLKKEELELTKQAKMELIQLRGIEALQTQELIRQAPNMTTEGFRNLTSEQRSMITSKTSLKEMYGGLIDKVVAEDMGNIKQQQEKKQEQEKEMTVVIEMAKEIKDIFQAVVYGAKRQQNLVGIK